MSRDPLRLPDYVVFGRRLNAIFPIFRIKSQWL
jgi:hypothetical protein